MKNENKIYVKNMTAKEIEAAEKTLTWCGEYYSDFGISDLHKKYTEICNK